MNGGVPIARIAGVEIRLTITLAMLLAVVTLIGAEQAAISAPDLAGSVQWLIGGLTALLFLGSIIAHELAHALAGRSRGVPTTSVVLGFLGALAPMSVQASRPGDELAIAISGPLLSLGLAAILLPSVLLVNTPVPLVTAVAGALLVVGGLNLVLGVLSLLPGVPLDGGRVVRALAWARTGDADRAGRVTVLVGRALGWGVAAGGIGLALAGWPSEGLLLVALGWLLGGGSRTMERRLALERALRGATVRDALVADALRIPAGLTADTFAERLVGRDGAVAAAVVDGSHVLGVIGASRVVRLRAAKLAGTHARDLMETPPSAPFLDPAGTLWQAVEVLNSRGFDALAVVAGGELLGLVTRRSASDVIRARWPDAAAPTGRRGVGRFRRPR